MSAAAEIQREVESAVQLKTDGHMAAREKRQGQSGGVDEIAVDDPVFGVGPAANAATRTLVTSHLP